MSSIAAPTSTATDLPIITIVYENRKSDGTTLTEGFGFSCVIEWQGRKILFDTGGKSDVFFANMGKLGIDLKSITHAVFSHRHWDHTAGFGETLGALKDGVSLYLPSRFDASLERKIPKHVVTHKVADLEEIDPDVFSLVLTGPYWLTTIQEQALVLRTSKGLVVLTGCAHPGIDRIARAALDRIGGRIHLVLGGFHLYRSWRSTCDAVVRAIRGMEVEKVAPCHCAGELAISCFAEAYGTDFISTKTGTVIKI